MQHAQPRKLDRRRIEKLLSQSKSHRSGAGRIETFSRHFLGHPYTTNPLIGSAESPEVFVASLNGFDCVTYVETILVLSRATNSAEFVDWLRKIRYEGGRVEWRLRNHYMTNWIRNNARLGVLRRLPLRGVPAVTKQRVLDVVPSLPPVRSRFECVPKRSLKKFLSQAETGDLIFFASTRKHLDVFHCGIIVRDGDHVRMRHASRSRGGVVEQNLDEFLKANRMAGVIVVRPIDGDLRS